MKSLRTHSRAGLFVLALLGLCFTPGAASAQYSTGRPSSWDNLKSLTTGQEIRVVMNNSKSFQGKFESFSDAGITLREAEGEQTLARKEVLRISRKIGQNHRLRNLLIGAAVGAGAGLGVGLAVNAHINNQANCTEGPAFGCGYPPNPHWAIILPPIGGLAGAIIGARLGKGGWHELYRSR